MAKATCSEDDCRETPVARGLCQRHYGIAYRRGVLPPRQPSLYVHSLSNVDRDARTADCSICGPHVPVRVRIRKKRGGVECMTKVRELEVRRRKPKPRRYRLLAKYNITDEDYERMFADQKGCCAICGSSEAKLFVDHDHGTGEVRGLLCHRCNIALGFLRDNADAASSASAYLKSRDSLAG